MSNFHSACTNDGQSSLLRRNDKCIMHGASTRSNALLGIPKGLLRPHAVSQIHRSPPPTLTYRIAGGGGALRRTAQGRRHSRNRVRQTRRFVRPLLQRIPAGCGPSTVTVTII
mmetsp:Transcript_36197/g.108431  ORF Transcript_36197/g.108431 Transcript_36197/m.108431 type:complete len:113 (+) Transcript_36197:1445-1783(+)